MANNQTFLKRVVAQIKSQEAETASDGTQAAPVTIQSRQDFDSIKNSLSAAKAAAIVSVISAFNEDSGESA